MSYCATHDEYWVGGCEGCSRDRMAMPRAQPDHAGQDDMADHAVAARVSSLACSTCADLGMAFCHCPAPGKPSLAEEFAKLAPVQDYRPAAAPPAQTALGQQHGGSHYKDMKIQPIEFIHANGIPFAEGNVIKYVSRWRAKGGINDLRKARHFLDLLIELETPK